MDAGSILFVEISVRDLTRAADFHAGLFGWSFAHDDTDGWFFTTGAGGLMGRIAVGRLAVRDGVRIRVVAEDVTASTSRAIELGGDTGEASGFDSSDVSERAVLINPDGTRLRVFHGRIRSRRHGRKNPGQHDTESQ